MEHADKTRVILTLNDEQGRSNFEEHTCISHVHRDPQGIPLFKLGDVWGSGDGLAEVGAGVSATQVTDPFFPGPGGVRFRLFTFMPAQKQPEGGTPMVMEQVQGEGLSNFADAFDPERPGMHISDTVDYVLCLSGQVILELDRGETLVRAGDVVITRGGWHNWRNEFDLPCTVISTMIGAQRRSP